MDAPLTQTLLKGATTVHRLDLPCARTGFSPPPCDVHIKFLRSPAGWTLVAHAAAGKPEPLARWLQPHPGVGIVRIPAGLAPKTLRASLAELPTGALEVMEFTKVHHLDLSPDGHACWFVEGTREQVWALLRHLEGGKEAAAREVRCRPVHGPRAEAPISRRQFEMLSTAVALGYYEIPHRLDLRALATRVGISLGSVAELLRRAEGAVLTHYIDSSLMAWPALEEPPAGPPFRSVENLLGR
jgi:hypothetical protein